MRLFIAITFPPEIKRQLAEYARAVGVLAARANVTREDNFHLTAAFLGEALTEAQACTALFSMQGEPFKLYSANPGCFRRSGGDIYWLGLKTSPELLTLQAGLSAALAAQGFNPEKQPFTPHITLARAVRGLNAEKLPPPPRFIVPVTGLTLMNSGQAEGRLTYSPLYEKRF